MPFATPPPAKIRTGAPVAARCRKGKEDEESVATNTRFGVMRAALVLQGSPNFGIPKDPFQAASGTMPGLCGLRRGCDRPSFLFWVPVSILLSVALTVVLNLLLPL